jgi:hypothetical protein
MSGLDEYMQGDEPQNYNNRYYSNSVSYNNKNYASETYGTLINQQYEDYKNRFLPYEKRLMSLADSTEMLDKQLERITTNVNDSYSDVGAQQEMMNQRYGLTQSAGQKQSQERNTSLNSAMSMAHAKNNTRVAHSDMQTGILTGASTGQQTFQQSQGG